MPHSYFADLAFCNMLHHLEYSWSLKQLKYNDEYGRFYIHMSETLSQDKYPRRQQ